MPLPVTVSPWAWRAVRFAKVKKAMAASKTLFQFDPAPNGG
jgi:hypothetical protein